MRTVKKGDQYQPDHGELVNIPVDDKDHYVVVVIGGFHSPTCYGCPLINESCDDWLDIPTPHKMIQLEEAVE